MYQLSFSFSEFLAEYWQKKPIIIKGGLFFNTQEEGFVDPISPDELAGLAMEEEIDSRFISNLNDDWQAEHGPFSEDKFAELGQSNWSLIVQAANHWHPQVNEMLAPFKTMPGWLFDDLMVSFAMPNGGVGPHIDQYDVFICQGLGKRHWRVGAKDEGQYDEVCRNSALRQIDSFDAIIDDVLEPGDILYIPPGFPHDGYALEASLSYSVGYRSPKEQELLSNFADYVLACDIGDIHLHNPDQKAQERHGMIQTKDAAIMVEMLQKATQQPELLESFLGCMLSQSRHQLNMLQPEEDWTADDLMLHIESGDSLFKVQGLRVLYHENLPLTLFINGEIFTLDKSLLSFVPCLTEQDEINADILNQITAFPEAIQLLVKLLNLGYWFTE